MSLSEEFQEFLTDGFRNGDFCICFDGIFLRSHSFACNLKTVCSACPFSKECSDFGDAYDMAEKLKKIVPHEFI